MIETISHYKILSRLGAGGMGEVYLANDVQLERKVAIKFLSPASAESEQARKRLVREAKAAAKLDHPNICAIYEVGEEGNRTFIVMQYVDGQTLAERMQQGRLQTGDVLRIATQICNALAEAHKHGIIHRDIKPQNMMITEDARAKVMDFGLAKIVGDDFNQTRAETQSLLTGHGVILGTVPYMSPEQVKGQLLDPRTDIFSFGILLYEMITGKRPFSGETAAALASAILTENPPPLSHHSKDVPEELERIVRKCLEKDRDQRYQTITDVSYDLSNIDRKSGKPRIRPQIGRKAGIFSLILLILTIGSFLVFRRTIHSPRQEIKSIAVLPLENLSGDLEQEYFVDGMTEALINHLAQIRALRVISRTSVMRYKKSAKSLPEIARELRVDAVIEGSVQRSGNRVRINAQLIHAETDAHLWARDYERPLSDILILQSEVARAVADEVRIQITPEERSRLASSRPLNPEAHEAYSLGRYHFNKGNLQDWQKAIEYFQRATALAADYAPAYAGLSRAWLQVGVFGSKLREVEGPSRAAALKAITLDEQFAEGHTALADIQFYCDWNWAGSEREYNRALQLDPGGVDHHRNYGHLLMALGRHDEAIHEGRIGLQLDPISVESQTTLGRFLYRARKYDEALTYLLRAVELEGRSIGANFRLGDVYAQLGRYEEALAAFEKGRQLTGDDRTFQAGIARVYALMGKRAEAEEMIRGIEIKDSILLAAVYTALGQNDRAFQELDAAVRRGDSIVVILKEDPPFEGLHSDPRWKALLARMNYPDR